MIVVTGATGGVGRYVVGELLEAGAKVCALTRAPERARLPAGVTVARTGDFPLAGATAVFLNPLVVWGSGAEQFLRQAAWHGVRRIVTLSSSAVLGGDDPRTNPIGVHHRELERAVEATGLEWTHVRPGAFASNSLGWVEQLRQGDVVRGPYADARSAPVHEADIAAVAARALLTDGLLGATPVLTGPESVSQADQVRIIGEATGRPLRYEEIDPAAGRAALTGRHMTPEIVDYLLRAFAESVGRPAEVSPETERITGRPGRTYAQWVADHVAAFR